MQYRGSKKSIESMCYLLNTSYFTFSHLHRCTCVSTALLCLRMTWFSILALFTNFDLNTSAYRSYLLFLSIPHVRSGTCSEHVVTHVANLIASYPGSSMPLPYELVLHTASVVHLSTCVHSLYMHLSKPQKPCGFDDHKLHTVRHGNLLVSF